MVNKSSIEFYTNLKRSAISKIETGIIFKEKFECPNLLEVYCEESQAMAFKKQLDKCCKKLSQDDDVYEAFKKTGRKMHTFVCKAGFSAGNNLPGMSGNTRWPANCFNL